MRCVKAVISGEVQGVGFRFHVKQEAERLRLTGFVKNMPNGEVEAVFCGEDEAVLEMLDWCEEGPPLAIVQGVEIGAWDGHNYRDFSIER